MARVVIFDVETDCSFASLQGMCREQQMKVMQVTVAVALEVDAGRCDASGRWDDALTNGKHHHWWRDQAPRVGACAFGTMLELFDQADVLVAFNGLDFDFPVLRKYYGHGKTAQRRYVRHRMKCHDPMASIQRATDVRFKLDDLLKLNHLPVKTGSGLDAIRMWETGRRDELLAYCARDVCVLAQMVCRSVLKVPVFGTLPNAAFGLQTALATTQCVRETADDDEFVLVDGASIADAVRPTAASSGWRPSHTDVPELPASTQPLSPP